MVYLSSIGNHVLRASRLNISSTLRLYSTGKIKKNIIIPDTTFARGKKEAIGIIGLGQMGHGMAKNLAAKTQGDLLVYDVNKEAVEKFVDQYPKAKAAENPAELADKAGTVITMLPEASHVQSVYASLIEAIDQDSLLIDSSTIDAESARSIAKQVIERKATPFDAPVSGGVVGAENGTLTFMVGAPSEADFEKIKPTLAMMGRNSILCGSNGTGQVAKLCNNMLLAVSMIGVSEALLLAGRLGMDPKLLGSIMNTSTGRCWSSDTNNPHPGVIRTAPANRDYAGGFANRLMAKDLRLAMKAAFDSGTTPILGTTAAQIYSDLSTMNDYSTLDFSSVYKWMKTDTHFVNNKKSEEA